MNPTGDDMTQILNLTVIRHGECGKASPATS
jgi:hypothetical protein